MCGARLLTLSGSAFPLSRQTNPQTSLSSCACLTVRTCACDTFAFKTFPFPPGKGLGFRVHCSELQGSNKFCSHLYTLSVVTSGSDTRNGAGSAEAGGVVVGEAAGNEDFRG